MKKIFSSILILLLISILAVGCGDSGSQEETPEANDTPPIEEVEEDTLSPEEDKEELDDNGEMGAKLSKAYSGMMKDKNYLMKYKMEFDVDGVETVGTMTTAVSGDKTAMITTMNGVETSIISKDDTSYMINHEEKTVLEIPLNMEMEDLETDEIEMDGLNYVGEGKEDGLLYEEYTTEDGNIKYYFDGDKLVKIVFEIDGESQEMEILEMTDKVPANMFELPADYQVMKFPGS